MRKEKIVTPEIFRLKKRSNLVRAKKIKLMERDHVDPVGLLSPKSEWPFPDDDIKEICSFERYCTIVVARRVNGSRSTLIQVLL